MMTILKEDLLMPNSSLCYSWRLFPNAGQGLGACWANKPYGHSPCSYWKTDEKGRFCCFSPVVALALVEQTLGQGLSLQETEPKSPHIG